MKALFDVWLSALEGQPWARISGSHAVNVRLATSTEAKLYRCDVPRR